MSLTTEIVYEKYQTIAGKTCTTDVKISFNYESKRVRKVTGLGINNQAIFDKIDAFESNDIGTDEFERVVKSQGYIKVLDTRK